MAAPSTETWFARNWGYIVAVALAIGSYLPAIDGGPIWDDSIVYERYLPNFQSLWDCLLPPTGIGELGELYYRPIVTASYLLDQKWYGGESHVGHHLTVIAFHALTVLFTGLLTRRLLPAGRAGNWGAFAAAMTFAVHPIHVDSVAQISGRCDPLAGAFLLGSMLLLLRGRERPESTGAWVMASMALLLALFSKEVAVAGAGLGALLLWLPRPAPALAWRRFGIGFGAALALYLLLRLAADLGSAALLDLSFGEAATRLIRGIGYDVQMSLLPWRQAAFVPLELLPPLWLGGVATAALLLAGWFTFRGRAEHPAPFVAWCWFGVTLAPALALLVVKASEQPVAERYLYVPSIGVSIAIGWLVAALAAKARARVVTASVVAVVVIAGAIVTSLRATIYRDAMTFWTDAVAKAPAAALPQYQLGLTLRRANKLDEAMAYLKTAHARYDDAEGRSLAENVIGTIHLDRQEWLQAEQWLLQATTTRPDNATAWFNLGGCYAMLCESKRMPPFGLHDLNDLERSVKALETAIAMRPNYQKAIQSLVGVLERLERAYRKQGKPDDAARIRRRLGR